MPSVQRYQKAGKQSEKQHNKNTWSYIQNSAYEIFEFGFITQQFITNRSPVLNFLQPFTIQTASAYRTKHVTNLSPTAI